MVVKDDCTAFHRELHRDADYRVHQTVHTRTSLVEERRAGDVQNESGKRPGFSRLPPLPESSFAEPKAASVGGYCLYNRQAVIQITGSSQLWVGLSHGQSQESLQIRTKRHGLTAELITEQCVCLFHRVDHFPIRTSFFAKHLKHANQAKQRS